MIEGKNMLEVVCKVKTCVFMTRMALESVMIGSNEKNTKVIAISIIFKLVYRI